MSLKTKSPKHQRKQDKSHPAVLSGIGGKKVLTDLYHPAMTVRKNGRAEGIAIKYSSAQTQQTK